MTSGIKKRQKIEKGKADVGSREGSRKRRRGKKGKMGSTGGKPGTPSYRRR